jgi:hypothetical protein
MRAARSAQRTLERLEATLLRSGGVLRSTAVLEVDPTDTRWRLALRLYYPTGHVLRALLVVDCARGYPAWVQYNFHLQDARRRCVWRYDNAPHYPELATFPHHKHVGPAETAVAAPQPTLRQLLAEIAQAVRGP